MQPAPPRRRPARPLPEAPVEALAADAERLAKGWLVAVIEQQPLSSAPAILAGEWVQDGPRLCEAVLRSIGADEPLGGLRGTAPRFAPPAALDALRAVVWSALRAAWPEAGPDEVWDLGERLAVVIDALRVAPPQWPQALDEAVAAARPADQPLAVALAELVDADRILAVEAADECAAVLAAFGAAVRGAAGPAATVVEAGEGRAWVIAPGTDRDGAEALGSGIAVAVRAARHWRGAPLTAGVGVAVLGEDGSDAQSLIEAAEQAVFAAAASGIEIERR